VSLAKVDRECEANGKSISTTLGDGLQGHLGLKKTQTLPRLKRGIKDKGIIHNTELGIEPWTEVVKLRFSKIDGPGGLVEWRILGITIRSSTNGCYRRGEQIRILLVGVHFLLPGCSITKETFTVLWVDLLVAEFLLNLATTNMSYLIAKKISQWLKTFFQLLYWVEGGYCFS
jgi:hypothetical protein